MTNKQKQLKRQLYKLEHRYDKLMQRVQQIFGRVDFTTRIKMSRRMTKYFSRLLDCSIQRWELLNGIEQ